MSISIAQNKLFSVALFCVVDGDGYSYYCLLIAF